MARLFAVVLLVLATLGAVVWAFEQGGFEFSALVAFTGSLGTALVVALGVDE